jgi:hypothetical protein
MILIGACDSATTPHESPRLQSTATSSNGRLDALRVKPDIVRDRLWVLGLQYIDVYDRPTDRLIRRIDLPRWTVADFVCPPDIAFDSTGAAYISHNVEPTLWQIDPDTFQLKEHRLRLLQREHLDIGLTKLRFASGGKLFAGASSGGSQWRIDLRSATGQLVEVAASVTDECGFRDA